MKTDWTDDIYMRLSAHSQNIHCKYLALTSTGAVRWQKSCCWARTIVSDESTSSGACVGGGTRGYRSSHVGGVVMRCQIE
jgi:hypothetical protein